MNIITTTRTFKCIAYRLFISTFSSSRHIIDNREIGRFFSLESLEDDLVDLCEEARLCVLSLDFSRLFLDDDLCYETWLGKSELCFNSLNFVRSQGGDGEQKFIDLSIDLWPT